MDRPPVAQDPAGLTRGERGRRPRTVFDRVLAAGGFCVHLVVAVDANVVVASGLLDGGVGDQDAVLGREKVEAQNHRPQDSSCMGTGSQGE